MLTVPALKVQQFGQELFLLNLSARDVDRMVRFEVLGDLNVQGRRAGSRSKRAGRSPVDWERIERKIQTSEKAYQRPILRKKIDELSSYYLQCKEDAAVPAIPGAVLLTTDEPVDFAPHDSNPFVGLLRLSSDEDSLRVLDGQHRLLALAALIHSPELPETDRAAAHALQVPAILFAGLPPASVVEMFVTINSKHTRLNPSLLYSLKGRQLYADPTEARVHDVIRKLNEAESSPLRGQIKMLGVGPGKVAQAGLAQELRRTLEGIASSCDGSSWLAGFLENLEKFYLIYFREIARAFDGAWGSKKHSIQSLIALRAFIQASQTVVPRALDAGGDPRVSVRALLAAWTERVGARRFETAGEWRSRAAGGGKETTRILARELTSALGDLS